MLKRSRMTQSGTLPPDFGAAQHRQRVAIPVYKCSISYSITSSARPSRESGTVAAARFPRCSCAGIDLRFGVLHAGYSSDLIWVCGSFRFIDLIQR